MSEDFYDRIAKAGYGDRADFVVLKNGGPCARSRATDPPRVP